VAPVAVQRFGNERSQCGADLRSACIKIIQLLTDAPGLSGYRRRKRLFAHGFSQRRCGSITDIERIVGFLIKIAFSYLFDLPSVDIRCGIGPSTEGTSRDCLRQTSCSPAGASGRASICSADTRDRTTNSLARPDVQVALVPAVLSILRSRTHCRGEKTSLLEAAIHKMPRAPRISP
jgi:hypothetical protein